jgi:HD-like signal output (HDOD) protein/CheY-like chemotaxis protein
MEARIIFVDDNPNVLEGLKRMLRAQKNVWHMDFVLSGAEALERFGQGTYDVIITDMKMPIMNGAQLLEEVKQLYPEVIRIILSGFSDKDMILQTVGVAHQFLSKPCDQNYLINTVQRAIGMRQFLNAENLRRSIAGIRHLPFFPKTCHELNKLLKMGTPSMDRIAAIVENDPAVSAKVLQLVNSGFFGLPQHITSVEYAISLLGLDTLQSIFMMVSVFSQIPLQKSQYVAQETLFNHSLKVGHYAQLIMKARHCERARQTEAFSAGLMHDLGKLILVSNLPDAHAAIIDCVSKKESSAFEAERKVMEGVSHAELGAYLLGIWGLPTEIIEAVGYHHFPQQCRNRYFTTLTAVHIADVLANSEETGYPWHEDTLDIAYLETLEVSSDIDYWRAMVTA